MVFKINRLILNIYHRVFHKKGNKRLTYTEYKENRKDIKMGLYKK